MNNDKSLTIWQDREVCFDLSFSLLKVRENEEEIDSINAVEDTKGNNGEKGSLTVTNLRLIWLAHKNPKVNLSIGFNNIVKTEIKTVKSRLKGTVQGLYVQAKYNQLRFEFIFTSLVNNSPRLFSTIRAVHKSYTSTKLYRDLKLRGAIIHDGNLLVLPDEVKVTAVTEKRKNPIITLESCDKQLIGQCAAKIRSLRKPEPYKGKGIKFVGEELRRKAGKSAKV